MKKQIVQFARDLRKNQTPAEAFFWDKVRNRKFHDYKFYRQYIIEHSSVQDQSAYFIADFFCHQNKLIIELDGPIHDFQKSMIRLEKQL